eukprot:GHVU01028102.1.p1 GENE.GHVU01028102.1~~GHVU01028102.1.p1  ORF type:complete len:492 (-),score=39.52 GHVU01028102.1:72-1445(-)
MMEPNGGAAGSCKLIFGSQPRWASPAGGPFEIIYDSETRFVNLKDQQAMFLYEALNSKTTVLEADKDEGQSHVAMNGDVYEGTKPQNNNGENTGNNSARDEDTLNPLDQLYEAIEEMTRACHRLQNRAPEFDQLAPSKLENMPAAETAAAVLRFLEDICEADSKSIQDKKGVPVGTVDVESSKLSSFLESIIESSKGKGSAMFKEEASYPSMHLKCVGRLKKENMKMGRATRGKPKFDVSALKVKQAGSDKLSDPFAYRGGGDNPGGRSLTTDSSVHQRGGVYAGINVNPLNINEGYMTPSSGNHRTIPLSSSLSTPTINSARTPANPLSAGSAPSNSAALSPCSSPMEPKGGRRLRGADARRGGGEALPTTSRVPLLSPQRGVSVEDEASQLESDRGGKNTTYDSHASPHAALVDPGFMNRRRSGMKTPTSQGTPEEAGDNQVSRRIVPLLRSFEA